MKASKLSLLVGTVIIVASALLLFIWDAAIISFLMIIIFEVVAFGTIYFALEKKNTNQTMLLSGLVTVNIVGLVAYIIIAIFASTFLTAIIIVSLIICMMYIGLFYFASRSYHADDHYRSIRGQYENCMLLLDQVINIISLDDKESFLEVKAIFKQLDLTKDYDFDRCEKILRDMKDGNVTHEHVQNLINIAMEFETISKQAKLGDI